MKHRLAVFIAALLTAFVLSTVSIAEQPGNPGIAPPNSHSHGASYGEWGARWWQWILSLPAPAPNGGSNPLFTDGAVDCSLGQSLHDKSNQVWFLAGRTCISNCPPILTANRTCSVPTGTALFFPVLNAAWDNIGFGTPPTNLTVDELKVLAAQFSEPAELHATIDGTPIQNLLTYRSQFAPFGYTIPSTNNLYQLFGLDIPGVNWPSTFVYPTASDGYYLMLQPLRPGTHRINFGGTAKNTGFALDITYTITVVPRGRI